jgi:hypothetical protein
MMDMSSGTVVVLSICENPAETGWRRQLQGPDWRVTEGIDDRIYFFVRIEGDLREVASTGAVFSTSATVILPEAVLAKALLDTAENPVYKELVQR